MRNDGERWRTNPNRVQWWSKWWSSIAAATRLYANLRSSFRLSLSVTMSARVLPLSGVPACGVPLCAVSQDVRDVVQVGIDGSACEESAIWLKSLPDDFKSELVEPRERRRASAPGRCSMDSSQFQRRHLPRDRSERREIGLLSGL